MRAADDTSTGVRSDYKHSTMHHHTISSSRYCQTREGVCLQLQSSHIRTSVIGLTYESQIGLFAGRNIPISMYLCIFV